MIYFIYIYHIIIVIIIIIIINVLFTLSSGQAKLYLLITFMAF